MAVMSAVIMHSRLSHEVNLHIMRKLPQSIQSILHHGGGDHVDSPFRTTFMQLEDDSGVGLTPNFGTQRAEAVS